MESADELSMRANNNIRLYVINFFSKADKTDIFLLFLLAVMLFYPLLFVGFTTRDDAEFAINLGRSTNLLETSSFLADRQGRFAFFWAYPLFRLPFLFDNPVWYLTVKLGASFSVLIAIYFAVFKVFKSSWLACLSLLFFLGFIQNGWDHNALTSYPVAFNLYAVLFLCSLGIFVDAIDKNKASLAVLSGVLYFFSIGIELFVLLFPLYVVVLLSRVKSEQRMINKLWGSKKYLLAIAIPLVLYLLIYAGWRNLHPSHYDGNNLDGFNLWAACKVIFTYSISAFPFASLHFLKSTHAQGQFSDLVGLSGILSQLNSIYFIKPAIVGFLFFRLMNKESCSMPSNRTLIASAVVAFVCIFIPNLLLGFVQKHQIWLASGSHSYLYTYYSFISAVIFAAIVAAYLNVNSRTWQPKSRLIMIVLMLFVVMFLSFAVEIRNQYIANDQKLSHRKWQLMDVVIQSPDFKKIPDGSVLLVPTLTMNHRGIAVVDAKYWSHYVKYKTGKNILFKEDKCNIGSFCYALIFRQASHTDNQFVVLSKLISAESLVSSELTIYYMSNHAARTMIGSFESAASAPKLQAYGADVSNIGHRSFSLTLPRDAGKDLVQTVKITGNMNVYPDQIRVLDYSF